MTISAINSCFQRIDKITKEKPILTLITTVALAVLAMAAFHVPTIGSVVGILLAGTTCLFTIPLYNNREIIKHDVKKNLKDWATEKKENRSKWIISIDNFCQNITSPLKRIDDTLQDLIAPYIKQIIESIMSVLITIFKNFKVD